MRRKVYALVLVALLTLNTGQAWGNGHVDHVDMREIWPNTSMMYDHFLVLHGGETWWFRPTIGELGFDFVYGGRDVNLPSDNQVYYAVDRVLIRYRFKFPDGTELWYVWGMVMAPMFWDGKPWVWDGVTTAVVVRGGRVVAGPIEARYRTTLEWSPDGDILWSQEWLDPQPLSEWRVEKLRFSKIPVYNSGGMFPIGSAWGPRELEVLGQDGKTNAVVIDHWQKR